MDFEKINHLRREYDGLPIDDDVNCPFVLFDKWFQDAIHAGIDEPNAMSLSTCIDGQPSSRIVLLKQYDQTGFYFFTNYQSRKGQEIENNPKVSLLFYWAQLFRQVRIEGIAQKISDEESNKYFYSRPIDSQVSAMISPQSKEIPSREWLIEQYENYKKLNSSIVRPFHWGGFVVTPQYFEFFQGMENRLHDRVVFVLNEKNWIKKRIAP
ncbi:MAG: pyridoxamine 5'-phosphate oxidase [Bacteroidales bacterium]|nr:pyridoxamine 5'-phosphate oxidase [Bacteroidales bacterium]